MLKTGRIISDRYRIETILGQGGMGTVYLCHDEQLDRRVAVKCLKNKIEKTSVKGKLIKEAKILAKFNHENIVQLYDIVETDNQIVLVMEYVHGTTLSYHLSTATLSLNLALYFFKQLCTGISKAHENGIIHKDIKADNILITNEGRLKVTDFGIAKVIDDINTHESGAMGSYTSLSPEQARGEALDQRTDIFSLGVLAYQMFAGQHPFGDSRNPVDFIKSLTKKTPTSLHQQTKCIPAALSQIISQMLEKDRDNRQPSLNTITSQLSDIEIDNEEKTKRELETLYIHPEIKSHENSNARLFPRVFDSHTLKRSNVLRNSLLIAALSIATLGSGLLIRNILNETTIDYVAIIEPTTSFEKSLKTPDHEVYRVVKDALEQTIINSKYFSLVSLGKFEEINESTAEIGSAFAATILIQPDVTCGEQRCIISLSKIDTHSSAITSKKSWPVLRNSALGIFDSVQSHIPRLLKKEVNTKEIQTEISEEDYLNYISMHEAYDQEKEPNLDNLIVKLEKIITANPKYLPLYQLYRNLLLDAYYKSSEHVYLDKLEEMLRRADRITSPHHSKLLNWFEFHLTSQNISESQKYIALIKKHDYPHSESAKLEARVQMELGNYEKAVALYKKSIALRPDIRAYNQLAQLYWMYGDTSSARKTLETIFDISPNNYDANRISAKISLSEGKLEESIQAHEILVSKHKSSQNHSNLGVVYLLSGKLNKAKTEFKDALKLSPQNPTFLLNLADIESLLGNLDNATKLYDEVLVLSMERDLGLELTLNLAQAQAHTGQNLEAIATMQKLLIKHSGNPNVLFTAALVYAVLKEYQSALVYFEQATELGLGPVWFNLPWFQPLCRFQNFSEQALQANSLCMNTP